MSRHTTFGAEALLCELSGIAIGLHTTLTSEWHAPRLWRGRDTDRRALVSASVRQACVDRGVELIRYTDLAPT